LTQIPVGPVISHLQPLLQVTNPHVQSVVGPPSQTSPSLIPVGACCAQAGCAVCQTAPLSTKPTVAHLPIVCVRNMELVSR